MKPYGYKFYTSTRLYKNKKKTNFLSCDNDDSNLESEPLNHFTVLNERINNVHSSYVILENYHRLVILVKLEGRRCKICGIVTTWCAVGIYRVILISVESLLKLQQQWYALPYALDKSKIGPHKELSKLQIL
jgi:hypothetical protein